jgi:hypothetical protein
MTKGLLGSSALATLASATAITAAALGPAASADLLTKSPPASCVQAVDGVNGKVAALGGSFADSTVYAGAGSLSLPFGCELGIQIDGTAGSFDSRFFASLGGHLFWRNPTEGLLGLYGSYSDWDQAGGVHVAHAGPEAEWYLGQWTLQGTAGVEFGNNTSATIGSTTLNFDTKTRFYDQLNLRYYLQDNFDVYAGHRYLGGDNALALGGEWGIPMAHGVMASLFAEGQIGQDNFHGVWGGLRFYFGEKDKSLIRRHREDDPTNWSIGDFGALSNNKTTSNSTTPTSAPSPPAPPPPPGPPG